MIIIFVHGWSVTHTNTYGDLPRTLAGMSSQYGISIDIQHIHLGKYISFHDEVTLDDIARAFNVALHDLPINKNEIKKFSCITHSTGGPVVRYWVDHFYGRKNLSNLPLKHLVMLAPANHGSSLAALGKKRVGRIKAWYNNIEPGQKVLDWLSLGSDGQWKLNEQHLHYKCATNDFYPFILIGQGIDTNSYDFLNDYLVEPGSDGVIRASGANLNYRYISLTQSEENISKNKKKKCRLITNKSKPVRTPQRSPIAILSQFSHSGRKMGIMANNVSSKNHNDLVSHIFKCLQVVDEQTYEQCRVDFEKLTHSEQQLVPKGKKHKIDQFSMIVFRIRNQQGEVIKEDDYDIFLLAGKEYNPNSLPNGFFIDKQMNTTTHCLVYYINTNKIALIKDGLFGVRIKVRPEKGFSYYDTAEYRSEGLSIEKIFLPNETTYIDVIVQKQVDKNVFRFSPAKKPHVSFKNIKPSGDVV